VTPDPVRAIADAVLYEGYILWPYRRSALKNQRRFTFGGVYPPAHSRDHPDDPAAMHTEVLMVASEQAQLDVAVRFLQVVRRAVGLRGPDGFEEVDELDLDGERYTTWEEAIEREVKPPPAALRDLARAPSRTSIAIDAGRKVEELAGGAGVLVRTWHGLEGKLEVAAERVDAKDAWRVWVDIENTTSFAGGSREEALAQTFCSTHTVLRSHQAEFVSLADPPEDLKSAAAACHNLGSWPVLVGEPGRRSTVLSSPIILEDYPRVAPESPGDLFDGGEIDQLLILNILALTDEEKAEMAASDPRAREILERTEALTPDQLMALHGTIREFGVVR
jgi:hydrogenase maturation protease